MFSKIILSRLTNTLDENQLREQAGCRKNFSTVDHIQVVNLLIQKAKEYGSILYIYFIDFTKAVDSLKFNAIWKALSEEGIDFKYVEILYSIYSKSLAKIKLETQGPEFPTKKGVRQGDPLSPKIFSTVLEMIFRSLDWENQGIRINGENLSHLRFADDIAIFSTDPLQLENMLQELAAESAKVGLSLNASKTKILTNGRIHDVNIDGGLIEYVNGESGVITNT